MTSSNNESKFNNYFLVFTHKLGIVNKNESIDIDTNNFSLNTNYRVVTLQTPGQNIHTKLVNIITNQIAKKSVFINQLFLIKCPIARGNAIIKLEDAFIRDYFIDIFNKNPEKIKNALEDILIVNNILDNFSSLEELKQYLDTLDYNIIKSNLNFKIRMYRPGDLCPKLLLNFKNQKIQDNLNEGIYKTNIFSNFNYNDSYKSQSLSNGFTYIEPEQQQSIMKFDENTQYIFDNTDNELKSKTNFFTTISHDIPSGLLIVLNCVSYNDKQQPYLQKTSLERQNATYKKYLIKYN
jgi:hypothetical protein